MPAFLVCLCAVATFADPPAADPSLEWLGEATNHLGSWIWETNWFDKQTVRLWKTFDLPAGSRVQGAIIRITVDNGYTLFLDGKELGRGSDWRTVTKYDVTHLIGTGRHVIAVDGFNDRLEGGLIFSLLVSFADGSETNVISDGSWQITALTQRNWAGKNLAHSSHPATVVGAMGTHPWEKWPLGLATLPPFKPLIVRFWQRGWFLLSLLLFTTAALLFSLWLLAQLSAQSRAQKVLQVERVRIARDIHDDLGAQLTQLLLLGEVAQREHPQNSPAQKQFTQICDHARELAHAMDEVVWAVNARRDTVRDFASYVCKYAQAYLSATGIRCRLDVEREIPATTFDLPVRRNLFLAVKEALNNAAKHSRADELFLRISRLGKILRVAVEDNGRGFAPEETGGERNGLSNMAQRMAEIGGTCEISSQPGGGCLVVFTVPLAGGRWWWFFRAAENELEK